VIEPDVLWPAATIRVPRIAPRVAVMLYSIAGAKPNAPLAPESSKTFDEFCPGLDPTASATPWRDSMTTFAGALLYLTERTTNVSPVRLHPRFVTHQTMSVALSDDGVVSDIAAAIAAPARASMLYSLVDGRARTSKELAMIADVSPSTASVHLQRLAAQRLVKVITQGKHHYYSLTGSDVATALGALSVLAGGARNPVAPSVPSALRAARTCYDHIAGVLGVALYDRLVALRWLAVSTKRGDDTCELTEIGMQELAALDIDVEQARALRRRFACACLDWSERRSHLGGAIGAALLDVALKRRWVVRDRDSRALTVTTTGRRALLSRIGLRA
jgi:DNA-binding transcriptional ArsR family regulator